MSRPGKQHKAKPETPVAPVLSRTDWMRLSLILLGVGVLFVGWSAFELHLGHEASLSRILSRWRAEYHLTEEQERLIRAEEERFHGTANPLTRRRRTPEEAEAHRLAVGHLMNPEDGARFLSSRKSASGNSTNQAQGTTTVSPLDLHP